MNVGSVMDGLGVRLATITGLRVTDFNADSVSVPAAVCSLPDVVTYDSTFARGCDEATFPVHVLVGKVSDRAARDALVLYMNGTGGSSVKTAIEADISLGGAAQTTRVTEVKPSTMTVGGVEYMAATFSVEVYA
jgi:hypothetical protein